MPKTDDKILDAYRELTAGLHKTGLTVHGVTVVQESHARRINALESTVTASDNSLQTRVARLEDRIARLEDEIAKKDSTNTAIKGAQIQSRATIMAAWVGALAGIVGAIIALVVAFK